MLANRVQKNERWRDLQENQRAWDKIGFNCPILREGIATACQCEPGIFQPNCRVQDTCPNTQRPVRLHFAPGADYSMARLM